MIKRYLLGVPKPNQKLTKILNGFNGLRKKKTLTAQLGGGYGLLWVRRERRVWLNIGWSAWTEEVWLRLQETRLGSSNGGCTRRRTIRWMKLNVDGIRRCTTDGWVRRLQWIERSPEWNREEDDLQRLDVAQILSNGDLQLRLSSNGGRTSDDNNVAAVKNWQRLVF